MASIRRLFSKYKAGGLYMKYSICLSIFIYKPWLVNEGGLNMREAYPTKYFPVKNKPLSNMSRAASDRGLTVVKYRKRGRFHKYGEILDSFCGYLRDFSSNKRDGKIILRKQ